MSGIGARFTALSALASRGGVAIAGAAGAIVALGAGLAKATKAGEEFDRSQRQIEALLTTTGNASGRTARQIEELAQSIDAATLASTTDVRRAAAQLLTFRSVSGEVFDETLRLAQDLASLGFGTLTSATVQLAKALEDPAVNLSNLRRVGVSFTQEQIKLIKALDEAGKKAEAQAIILQTLREQVGGAGAAQAGGLTGAFDELSRQVRNFFENIGQTGVVDAFCRCVARCGQCR